MRHKFVSIMTNCYSFLQNTVNYITASYKIFLYFYFFFSAGVLSLADSLSFRMESTVISVNSVGVL